MLPAAHVGLGTHAFVCALSVQVCASVQVPACTRAAWGVARMSEPLREEILSRKAAREAGRASPPSAHVDGARPDTTQHSPVRTRRRAQADGSAGPLVAELLSRLKSRRGGQLGAGLQARLSEVEHRAKEGTSQPPIPPALGVAPHEGAPVQLASPEQERDEGNLACEAPPGEALDTSAGLATPDPAMDGADVSAHTNLTDWPRLRQLRDDHDPIDDASRISWAKLARAGDANGANDAFRRAKPTTWAALAELPDDSYARDDAGDPNDASGDANLTGWAKLARWEDDSDTTGDADDASPGTFLGHP